MRLYRLTAPWLALASLVAAQDIAPEVLLLARIKSHMREELAHLPNYTCLETIARFHKEPGHSPPFQGPLKPLDTVRLEIVYTNGREWYGSPGDRNLSSDHPAALVGSGMIGNGTFAMDLSNIFEAGNFTYRGEEAVGSRMAVRYDFHLSANLKAFAISIRGGRGTVGEKGSLWADRQSLDLLRVESSADEIPRYLPVEEQTTKMNYARTRIGAYDVLLAQQADVHMLESSGIENYDRLEFTHCRAFSAQSSIRFDPEPQQPAKASFPAPIEMAAPEGATGAVPAFLPITIELTTPIHDKDAVGRLIEGRVSGDVLRKGKVIIPNGSVVRGRIRRLERYQGPPISGGDFIVGLEFTDVEAVGGPLRFYADLLRIERTPGVRPSLSDRVLVRDVRGAYEASDETITLPELPGVASFFVRGTSFTLARGFRMYWRTRGLIRQ